MSEFHTSLKVEDRSTAILKPFFESKGWTFGEKYPAYDKRGDYPVTIDGVEKSVEFKAEETWTGNLFFEFMSNAYIGRQGWLYTLKTDLLVYHFLDKNVVYVLDFPLDLQKIEPWKYKSVVIDADQNNQTLGWLVRIDVLEALEAAKSYELNSGNSLETGTCSSNEDKQLVDAGVELMRSNPKMTAGHCQQKVCPGPENSARRQSIRNAIDYIVRPPLHVGTPETVPLSVKRQRRLEWFLGPLQNKQTPWTPSKAPWQADRPSSAFIKMLGDYGDWANGRRSILTRQMSTVEGGNRFVKESQAVCQTA